MADLGNNGDIEVQLRDANENLAQITSSGEIKTKDASLDTSLSTRLAESTFTNRVGEVQASPTQYTVLARLKDIWDRLATTLNVSIQNATLAVTQSGIWTMRLLDGVGNAITSTVESATRRSLDVNIAAFGNQQAYVATALGSTVGANKYHCNLYNATGSGYIIKINRIRLVNFTDALSTGHNISCHALRSSTTGTGTTTTIVKIDTNNINLPVQITMRGAITVAPTVSDNLGASSIDTEESRPGVSSNIFEVSQNVPPIILRANEGIAIQQNAYASGGKISIYIYFTIEV